MQSLSACMSPAFASSMAFRVRASPSPSSNASIASVALLREPAGLPFGLPDRPGLNGTPRCFSSVLAASLFTFSTPIFITTLLRTTIFAAMIITPRRRLAILIVARFPPRISRYIEPERDIPIQGSHSTRAGDIEPLFVRQARRGRRAPFLLDKAPVAAMGYRSA